MFVFFLGIRFDKRLLESFFLKRVFNGIFRYSERVNINGIVRRDDFIIFSVFVGKY